jgi:hypothetical protein
LEKRQAAAGPSAAVEPSPTGCRKARNSRGVRPPRARNSDIPEKAKRAEGFSPTVCFSTQTLRRANPRLPGRGVAAWRVACQQVTCRMAFAF